MLTNDEQRGLLLIARRSIRREMRRKHAGLRSEGGHEEDAVPAGVTDRKGGAFVTLRLLGDLRGCIGYIEFPGPVRVAVEEIAKKAAFEDPRFTPLTPAELDRVTIEVSVLSPVRRISSPDEIEIGRDGLILESGMHRGLLLPQVATEYGWDVQEFLEHTARKAGLAADAWKHPHTLLYTFTAEVFSEPSVERMA